MSTPEARTSGAKRIITARSRQYYTDDHCKTSLCFADCVANIWYTLNDRLTDLSSLDAEGWAPISLNCDGFARDHGATFNTPVDVLKSTGDVCAGRVSPSRYLFNRKPGSEPYPYTIVSG